MRKHRFTLIELLVVVALIGILVSLLLPALAKVRRITKEAVCISNQAQISKAMSTYTVDSNGSVPVGHVWTYRYSMALWSPKNYGSGGNGWMALGLLYKDSDMTNIATWTCPSRTSNVGWAKTNPKNWPPGQDTGALNHADYVVRASDDSHDWTNKIKVPKLPSISSLESNTTYTADTFGGFEYYSYRHGLYKTIIFSRIDGSARRGKDSGFHSKIQTMPDWNSASDNSKIKDLWETLDSL